MSALEKFLKTLQWNGTYAADFHQNFSGLITYTGLLDEFQENDELEEIKQYVVQSISQADSYRDYLAKKVEIYNQYVEKSSQVSLDVVLQELYTDAALELEDKVTTYRSFAYSGSQVKKFSEIDYDKALDAAADILIIITSQKEKSIKASSEISKKIVGEYIKK